jgi:hypothetical protein
VDEERCLNHVVEKIHAVVIRRAREVQSESVLMEVVCYKKMKECHSSRCRLSTVRKLKLSRLRVDCSNTVQHYDME